MSGDSNTQSSRFSLTSNDGIKLQGFRVIPQKTVCSLIVVHGVGEHSKRYTSFAKKISNINCTCYLYDQRGHGKSGGKRGYVEKFENYTNDLLTVYDLVSLESQGRPIFLYGHSMGSIVAVLFALKYQTKIRGLVVTGFPILPSIPIAGIMLKLIKYLGALAPLFSIPTMINVKHLSHDKNVWDAYKQDHMINKTVTLSWAAEFYSALERLKDNLCKLKLPLLMMHGSDDRIARLNGAKQAIQIIPSKDKTLRIYEGQRHELLNEISPIPDRVTEYMMSWIKLRVP